jgi:hypothetical protein
MASSRATRHHRLVLLVLVILAAAIGGVTFGTRTGAAGVELNAGDPVSFATPPFLVAGKRYAFTWPGGGPPQTYTIKSIRRDGWVAVEVADDNTNPAFYVQGELPVMWLHVGMAISVQPMRPLQ